MKARLGASWTRHLGLSALSVALLASPAVTATAADATVASGGGVPCLTTGSDDVPAARRIPDTPAVSMATVERVLDRVRSAQADSRESAAPPVYRVKVQIHVIHGRHRHERRFKRPAARRMFGILRDAYNGMQSTWSEQMGVRFVLRRITITQNDDWYHARPMSRLDRQMKKRLHRGRAQTLNIYVNKPTYQGGGLLLGYSRFPWQYRAHPRLDGVTVNVRGMPRGNATGYNKGDTVVHETGHWLGLLHTFQNGCATPNDGVVDTPAERDPNFTCVDPILPGAKSTVCDPTDLLMPGIHDPAFNFMDYSFDSCMRMFTLGQRKRVDSTFATYRLGR